MTRFPEDSYSTPVGRTATVHQRGGTEEPVARTASGDLIYVNREMFRGMQADREKWRNRAEKLLNWLTDESDKPRSSFFEEHPETRDWFEK